MESLVNEAGLLGFLHDLTCLFFRDHLGKALGGSMTGGFTEGEAVSHRCVRIAGVPQDFSPLPAETVAYRDIVELINNFLHRLARQNELCGHLDVLIKRNDSNGLAVFCISCGHGPVDRRSALQHGD